MSMPTNYHVNFTFQSKNYSFDLLHDSKLDSSLKLGGVNYSIIANTGQLEDLIEIFSALSLDTICTPQDLAEKLKVIKNISTVSVTSRVNGLGVSSLGVNQTPPSKPLAVDKAPLGEWMQEESQAISKERRVVSEKYWDLYGKQEDHPSLLDFLRNNSIENVAAFEEALESKNKEKFISLFNHLSRNQIQEISYGEGLQIFPERTFDPARVISETDMKNLEDYLNDLGFSGVVALTSHGVSHSIKTSDLDLKSPMSIHSVGKAFTGILLMILIQKKYIEEPAIDQPIQLEPHVIQLLPQEVQNHLKHTTLRQVMEHTSGFGDYLGNYQDAIKLALDSGQPFPKVEKPEDFLQFINKEQAFKQLAKGEKLYSNVGSLLFGLSLQYHYNKNREKGSHYMPFESILREYLIKPAKLTSFSETRPKNASYNRKDENDYIYGGPAVGYWMSVKDLDKFGQWVSSEYKKATKESSLADLLQNHGNEFFSEGILEHNGAVPSASARLTSFLNHGISIAILSKQGKLDGEIAADKIYFKILEKLLTHHP